MTIAAVFGGKESRDFATIKGLGDVIRWVDSLDKPKYPLITHLTDWGWVSELESLKIELTDAMVDVTPTKSVRDTLDEFIEYLVALGNDVQTVALVDGLSSG